MPKAERGVVKSPNADIFATAGDPRNSYMPLARESSPVAYSNLSRFMHGDPGGSSSLARQTSAVPVPNQRFDVDNVNNSQIDNFPVQPGRGAVPVNPFLADGPGLARAKRLPDDAETL